MIDVAIDAFNHMLRRMDRGIELLEKILKALEEKK